MKYVLLLLAFTSTQVLAQVAIQEGYTSEGQESYEITTPSARYIYQLTAGGFSSIFDSQGVDWVQFHKTENPSFPSASASDYRGVPNLVFKNEDGGCGHPGFEKMTSEIIAPNQIRSTSLSKLWQWTWTFYENHAVMNLERIDTATAFWFLYEGPIAGHFSPSTHYWGTDEQGPRTDRPDLINGPEIYETWQTCYFGDDKVEQVFFVHQVQPDDLEDLFAYMGTDQQRGNASEEGMVVFGFGRGPRATPLLKHKNQFLVGFYPLKITSQTTHTHLLSYINKLSK